MAEGERRAATEETLASAEEGRVEVGRPAVLLVCGTLVYYHCAYRGSSLLSLVSDVLIVLLCSLAILGMLFRQMNISAVCLEQALFSGVQPSLSWRRLRPSAVAIRCSLLQHLRLLISDPKGSTVTAFVSTAGCYSLANRSLPLKTPLLFRPPNSNTALLQLSPTLQISPASLQKSLQAAEISSTSLPFLLQIARPSLQFITLQPSLQFIALQPTLQRIDLLFSSSLPPISLHLL
ncbi:uncharacterized protein LOC135582381 isoform X1 [Musa acuminata AAA Group]|uniref:uncharacterized protein LOC135582381 isoform X1 n=1 Tax=Musa acuminata AAA Group TaxID=214697 RepID=UPI0031DEF088